MFNAIRNWFKNQKAMADRIDYLRREDKAIWELVEEYNKRKDFNTASKLILCSAENDKELRELIHKTNIFFLVK